MSTAEIIALLEQLASYAPQRLKDKTALHVQALIESTKTASHPLMERWACEAAKLAENLRASAAFAVPEWVKPGAFAGDSPRAVLYSIDDGAPSVDYDSPITKTQLDGTQAPKPKRQPKPA